MRIFNVLSRAAATFAVMATTLTPLASWAQITLRVGDLAPPLAIKKFVKGTPVPKLPKGKVSVVEFWATWCGPCIGAMPHLSELARKYPQVTFVSVNVMDSAGEDKVAKFVAEQGDKMDYHVGLDDDKKMETTWMKPAGLGGIPASLIVDTGGKIAWIGHPLELDDPLAKIAAGGTWGRDDIVAKAKREFVQGNLGDALDLLKPLDLAIQIKFVDDAVAANPSLEQGSLFSTKYELLKDKGSMRDFLDYFRSQIDGRWSGRAITLCLKALDLIHSKDHGHQLAEPAPPTKAEKIEELALALRAARKADALTQGKSFECADALALACFLNGDRAGAVEAATRAIALTDPSGEGFTKRKQSLALYQDPKVDLSPEGCLAQAAIAAQTPDPWIYLQQFGDSDHVPLIRRCTSTSDAGWFIGFSHGYFFGLTEKAVIRREAKNKSKEWKSPAWLLEEPTVDSPAGTLPNYILIDETGHAAESSAKNSMADKRIMGLLADTLNSVFVNRPPVSVATRPVEAGQPAAEPTYMIVDDIGKEVPLTVEIMKKS